jgi:hypothetical protein
MVTTDLMASARAGDGDAFRRLTEPHRRELQVHCYRMLGSFQDAEDALQDTLLAAWQGLGAFEGRASVRTWLYRIATNRCLSALRMPSRRPAKEWKIPGVEPPEPTGLGEVVWLEPYPDTLLAGAIDAPRPRGPLLAKRGRFPRFRDRTAGPPRSPCSGMPLSLPPTPGRAGLKALVSEPLQSCGGGAPTKPGKVRSGMTIRAMYRTMTKLVTLCM